ncbi:hypothetical protein DFQ14_103109 [Halopolyspora algeriensis]|uniref:Uncharacterized protein n=2 Tax=Halopolyspora algeriensis TaxID=1500506 RepID=A0A368VTR4_9ACTN|nr:hypothetical protein [Halopolyspora algeriensis]RCW45145.1 hypothetical protein DFQ14_103109 [Halopolyspora algeriensis]TQM53134.1 hypothetical protein FHU43_2515 [Halopolyspora algeriensis]
MRLRLTGGCAETARLAEDLQALLATGTARARYAVCEVSGFYPNRGNTDQGRVYLELDVEPTDEGGGAR